MSFKDTRRFITYIQPRGSHKKPTKSPPTSRNMDERVDLFKMYFLAFYSVPDTVIGTEDTAV